MPKDIEHDPPAGGMKHETSLEAIEDGIDKRLKRKY
jgi:hypothetical protein